MTARRGARGRGRGRSHPSQRVTPAVTFDDLAIGEHRDRAFQDEDSADILGRVPRGVRLGVDVGEARVGLAACDPDGLVATPVATLRRDHSVTFSGLRGRIGDHDLNPTWPQDISRIANEVQQRDAQVVYVGLPRHLSGVEGQASGNVRKYAQLLAAAVEPVAVRLVDERMTTVTAHRVLHAAGRQSRQHRQVVDQVAAVEILQLALDIERAQHERAGELVQFESGQGEA